jgi:hypothetical protein
MFPDAPERDRTPPDGPTRCEEVSRKHLNDATLVIEEIGGVDTWPLDNATAGAGPEDIPEPSLTIYTKCEFCGTQEKVHARLCSPEVYKKHLKKALNDDDIQDMYLLTPKRINEEYRVVMTDVYFIYKRGVEERQKPSVNFEPDGFVKNE